MDSTQFAIAIAQIVVFAVNALLYARQKSALDIEKRDRGTFGVAVTNVERIARDAASSISHLTFEHYETLRSKYETLMVEYRDLQAHVRSLEESVASLSNKLASRDRADTARERRAAQHEAAMSKASLHPKDDGGAEESGDPLADLIARGQAIPLPRHAAPEATAMPDHFGRSAREG